MEERSFDDLTRVLGAATSRRQVLKGLLGSVVGGVLVAVGVRAPREVLAAAPTCNGVSYDPNTQCCEPAGLQPRYPIANLDLCPNRVPHAGHVPSFNGCGPENGFGKYVIPNKIGLFRNIDFTPSCNNHDICYDTCNSDKSSCDQAFLADMSRTCYEAYPGRSIYNRYMRGACEANALIYYSAVSRTQSGTDAYESAQSQACDCCAVCGECGGPGDERCCNGVCYATCPVGKHRDPDTCECVDDDGGGKGGDCLACQTGLPGQCVADPSQDGTTCGACGKCANGVCIPDPNRTCPTCHQCGVGGICDPMEDNTACGSNEVCCDGTCTAGTSCAPCPSGSHQCPPDIDGYQSCCPDGVECCTDQTGYTACGPTKGVCCPVGTTFQCDTSCCDVNSEQCLYSSSTPGDLSTSFGGCCPNDAIGLLPDGTCCPAGHQLCGQNNEVCCASGERCSQGGGAYPEVMVCCSSDTMGVLPDGTCCPASSMPNHGANGWICCDVSLSEEACCGCATGQVIQICSISDNDDMLVCCDEGSNCC